MMKLIEEMQRFSSFLKLLDPINAKISTGLADHGPRNIAALAKSINLPITTVAFRLKKMIEKRSLLITANLNLPRLGLAKGFVMAEAFHGRHDTLLKVIENTNYWTYIIRCYGKIDGYCAYFAFPADHRKELENYFEEASRLHVFSQCEFFWITNSRFVPPDFSWYNFEEKQWKFAWEQWIDETLNASKLLPSMLKEPAEYPILVDKKDLIILKELEKDGTVKLNKLAKLIKVTPQTVGSRYHRHIVKRNLIVNYNVDAYTFPLQISNLYNFIFDFENEKALAKFVNSSYTKPFVISYAKVIGQNSLVTNILILKTEFPNLIKSLNRLFAKGLIKDFFYVTLDIASYMRQTISYEHFEDKKWHYNHKEKIEKLKQIAK